MQLIKTMPLWGNVELFQERHVNYEVKENETAFDVSLELPGVTKDLIQVLTEDSTLRVVYKKRDQEYRREFQLGDDLDKEGISGILKDGVLKLTIPKRQKKITQITIAS